jgi:hypothetical protein
MDVGVPRDEVKFYHEVLRRGRSLVIANADGEELAQGVRTVFKQQGGGDVEAARTRNLRKRLKGCELGEPSIAPSHPQLGHDPARPREPIRR